MEFIVYCVFGDTHKSVAAIINRAYVDMASHTMTGFDDTNEKWDCRYKASELIKDSLAKLEEKDFDIWHKELCNSLISIYPDEKLKMVKHKNWLT